VISFAPTCQRRSPILNVVLMVSLGFALMLLMGRLLHADESVDPRAATVRVWAGPSQGSGVCVSPDGLIITAAHVVNAPVGPGEWAPRGSIRTPASVEVEFQNKPKEKARVVIVSGPGQPTDVAILQCAGRGYPCLQLAQVSPSVGDQVVTLGFPAGRFARLEGEVTHVGLTEDKSHDVITSWGRPNPGHSGGPLIDSDGHVVGVCSMGTVDISTWCGKIQKSEQVGMYARVESIHGLMAQSGLALQLTGKTKVKTKLKFKVWVKRDKTCRACELLKADLEAGRIRIGGKQIASLVDITWCDVDRTPKEAAAAGVTSYPTMIMEETGDRVEGYINADEFAARVSVLIGPQDAPAFDPPAERPRLFPDDGAIRASAPPAPPSNPVDAAATDLPATVDGTGLRVVLLVKQQDLSWWQGQAVAAAEKFAENGLRNKINAALGGKADVLVCFQRTQPKRYADLVTITGASGTKNAAVIVLVPETAKGVLGTVAGLIEGKLQKLTDGDWKHASVETIYEREDPDNYQAVIESLDKLEVAPAAGDDQSWWAYLVSAIGGTVAGLRDAFLGAKAKGAKA